MFGECFVEGDSGGMASWAKLGLWGHTTFERIIYMDVDTVVLGPLDEMARFPQGDVFAPDTCSNGCATIAGGLNAGVMLIRPSHSRLAAMQAHVLAIGQWELIR